MPQQDLLTVSLIAFGITFLVLAFLAGVIRLIMIAFPARETDNDSALVAAVTSVYSTLYPGTRLTTMEEQR